MWLIVWLVYALGCLLSVYPIAKAVIRSDEDPTMQVTGEDIMMGLVMGFCFCWAWPFAIPGWFIYKALWEDHK